MLETRPRTLIRISWKFLKLTCPAGESFYARGAPRKPRKKPAVLTMKLACRSRLSRAELCPRRIRGGWAPGLTLLELTLVIMMTISLIGIVLIGAKTWKKGSDRALCILNLQAIQRSVRSFSNLNGYQPGNTVSGLENRIIGTGCFLEKMPVCPGEGIYTSAGDTIPMPGSLYFSCSLADTGEHVPTDMDDW